MRKNFLNLFMVMTLVVTILTMGVLTLIDKKNPETVTPAEEVYTYFSRRFVNGTVVDYESIEDAISIAEDGESIEILKSHDVDQTIIVDKLITLYSSQQDIVLTRDEDFFGSFFSITQTGDLTLGRDIEVGSLVLDGQNKAESTSGLVFNAGKLTLKTGAIITKSSSSVNGSAIVVNGGLFTLQGGQLSNNTVATAEQNGAVFATNGGHVNIISGRIETNIFAGQVAGVFTDDGYIQISGGIITVPTSKYGIGVSSTIDENRLSITGGTINNISIQGSSATIDGGNIGVFATKDSNVTIKDGQISNHIICDNNSNILVSGGLIAKVIQTENAENIIVDIEQNSVSVLEMYDSMTVSLHGAGFVDRVNLHGENSIFITGDLTTNKKIVINPDTYKIGQAIVEFDENIDVNIAKFDLFDNQNFELIVLDKLLTISTRIDFEILLDYDSFVVTGDVISPQVIVKLSGETLAKDTNYLLSGELSAIEIGSYQIIVSGVGIYANKQKTINWQIVANPFELAIILEQTEFAYTGEEINVIFDVHIGLVAVSSELYTIVSGNLATNPGVYTLVIEGTGIYAGKQASVIWEILPSNQEFNVSLVQNEFLYDGNQKQPQLIVQIGGQDISSEFYMLGGDIFATAIGEYTITITGVSFYNNQTQVTWNIVVNNSPLELTATVSSFVFDYDLHQPEFVVKIGENILTNDVDYTLSGNISAQDAGQYTITATGINNYSGVGELVWEIRSLQTMPIISEIDDFQYNEQELTPMIVVHVGNVEGVEGVDYTLSGDTAGTEVGIYTIVITLIGNYSGTASAEWHIVENDTPLNIVFEPDTYVYTGLEIIPTYSIRLGERVLSQDKYSISGANASTNVGDYDIQVNGLNGYTGIGQATWHISPIQDNLTVEIDPESYYYDGSLKTPDVIVSCNLIVLESSEYTLSGDLNKTDVGVYEITAVGNGNYTGTGNATWEIFQGSQQFNMTLPQIDYTYNREIQQPTPIVTNQEGIELICNTDYTITYSGGDFILAGTYTVTVTGIGYYSGTISADWIIDKVGVTIDWEPSGIATWVYDKKSHGPQHIINGFIYPDNEKITVCTSNGSKIEVGFYVEKITLYGKVSVNYYIASGATKEYSITKATITGVVFNSSTVTYETSQFIFAPTKLPVGTSVTGYSTLAQTYNADGSLKDQILDTTNQFSNAGYYIVTAMIYGGNNYEDTTVSATLQINRCPVTFTANNYSGECGSEIVFPLEYAKTDGIIYPDDMDSVYATLSISTTVTSSSSPGEYPISLSSIGHENYEINCVNGVYTVKK